MHLRALLPPLLAALLALALLAQQQSHAPAAQPPPAAALLTLALLGFTAITIAADELDAAARRLRWLGLAALSLLPIAVQLSRPGLPLTHDLPVHAWTIYATAAAQRAGDWWPGWLDLLGLGQPVLHFYAPATYLAGGLLLALGLTVPTTVSLLGWASGALGAGTTYLVLRDRAHGPTVASLGAAAFLLTPYRLLDLNYRFALGELFGLTLLLPFWHFTLLTASGRAGLTVRRPAIALTLTAVGLTLTHGLTALLAVVGGALLLLTHTPLPVLPRAARRLTAPALLSVGLSAPLLLPAALEQDEVSLHDAVPQHNEHYAAYALRPLDPLGHPPWSVHRIDEGLANPEQRMPFTLGWLWLAGLTLGLRHRPSRPWLLLSLAAWVGTWWVSSLLIGKISLFRSLQFPWRLLGVSAVAALPVAADVVQPWVRTRALPLALGALLLLDAWSSLGASGWVRWADHPSPQTFAVHPLGERGVELVGSPILLFGTDSWTDEWRGAATGDLPPRTVGLVLPPRALTQPVANVWRAAPEYFTRAQRDLRAALEERDPDALREADAAWPPPERPGSRLVLEQEGRSEPVAGRLSRARPDLAVWSLPDGLPPGRLVWREARFPGWQVSVDGGPWRDVQAGPWLAVDLPAEVGTVAFRYGRATWPRRLGDLIGLAALIALAAAARATPPVSVDPKRAN
jgi:hypothetical protein